MTTHFKGNQKLDDMLTGKILSIFQEVADELYDRGYHVTGTVDNGYAILIEKPDGTYRFVEGRKAKEWVVE